MEADLWASLSERQRATLLRQAKKYPCEQCAYREDPKCRMGFLIEKDGEPGGCLVRKYWWKPREP